jgi:hypothetical protein
MEYLFDLRSRCLTADSPQLGPEGPLGGVGGIQSLGVQPLKGGMGMDAVSNCFSGASGLGRRREEGGTFFAGANPGKRGA